MASNTAWWVSNLNSLEESLVKIISFYKNGMMNVQEEKHYGVLESALETHKGTLECVQSLIEKCQEIGVGNELDAMGRDTVRITQESRNMLLSSREAYVKTLKNFSKNVDELYLSQLARIEELLAAQLDALRERRPERDEFGEECLDEAVGDSAEIRDSIVKANEELNT